MNMNANNNFDGSLHHQKSFAYSYNEGYIYFNNPDQWSWVGKYHMVWSKGVIQMNCGQCTKLDSKGSYFCWNGSTKLSNSNTNYQFLEQVMSKRWSQRCWKRRWKSWWERWCGCNCHPIWYCFAQTKHLWHSSLMTTLANTNKLNTKLESFSNYWDMKPPCSTKLYSFTHKNLVLEGIWVILGKCSEIVNDCNLLSGWQFVNLILKLSISSFFNK